MNMAQRAARHQKMEGLLAYAAAYGEDAEAERLRSMFARLITGATRYLCSAKRRCIVYVVMFCASRDHES